MPHCSQYGCLSRLRRCQTGCCSSSRFNDSSRSFAESWVDQVRHSVIAPDGPNTGTLWALSIRYSTFFGSDSDVTDQVVLVFGFIQSSV